MRQWWLAICDICVEDKYLNKGHLYKSQNAKMREFQIVASDTLD